MSDYAFDLDVTEAEYSEDNYYKKYNVKITLLKNGEEWVKIEEEIEYDGIAYNEYDPALLIYMHLYENKFIYTIPSMEEMGIIGNLEESDNINQDYFEIDFEDKHCEDENYWPFNDSDTDIKVYELNLDTKETKKLFNFRNTGRTGFEIWIHNNIITDGKLIYEFYPEVKLIKNIINYISSYNYEKTVDLNDDSIYVTDGMNHYDYNFKTKEEKIEYETDDEDEDAIYDACQTFAKLTTIDKGKKQ